MAEEGERTRRRCARSCAGEVQGVGFRDATVQRARELGVMGWVRNGEDGSVLVHAEGPEPAVEELVGVPARGAAGRARSPRSRPSRSRSRATSSSRSAASAPAPSSSRSTPPPPTTSTCASRSTGRCAPGRSRRAPRWTPPSSASPCRSRTTRSPTTTSRARSASGGVIVWDRGTLRAGRPGRLAARRSSAATPSSSSTARSCAAASPCSAPAPARSPSGC